MDTLTRFDLLLAMPVLPLDEAVAVVAAHGRPGVDADDLVARIDALAASVTATDAPTLCAELFGPAGYRGDEHDYFSAENSLLDQVLERRRGLPISLSILAIEVGRRIGVELVGVGMPGHFLIREQSDPSAFYDPFRGGAPLDADGCRRVFEQLHGPAAPFEPAFLAPAPPRAIVSRVLANLQHAYRLRSDRPGLIRTLEIQLRMPGAGIDERRALADLLAQQGRFDDAADLREALMDLDPEHDQHHAREALRLRARLN